MLKKTLVIGASGFIGSNLFLAYKEEYPDLIGTSFKQNINELTFFELGKSQLSDLKIIKGQYDSAVITAGITNISYINNNPELSYEINVAATLALVKELNELDLHIIFLSSDNVFTGDKGQYTPNSKPVPVSNYGAQKLAVERGIQDVCDNYSIVRLAKAIGFTKADKTILDDISSQLIEKSQVMAAEDLIFNPTSIEDIVSAIQMIQANQLYGILNFCSPEIWNRYLLTVEMAKRLSIDLSKIKKINFSDLDSSGKRPLNTTMLNSECFADFKFKSIETCMNIVAENWK